jgi:hypothetical protein
VTGTKRAIAAAVLAVRVHALIKLLSHAVLQKKKKDERMRPFYQ